MVRNQAENGAVPRAAIHLEESRDFYRAMSGDPVTVVGRWRAAALAPSIALETSGTWFQSVG
jgi:hypothetical protein